MTISRTVSPGAGAAATGQTLDWGRMPYPEAFERQLETVQARMAGGIPDTLILTEHDPVYTIGARKGADQHLVWHEEKLREAGIAVVKTNRGGDITYHGPGQLVGYPILDLRGIRDLHRYLRELEEVLIAAVGSFGIAAHRRPGMTGIWADTRKLAAIGVAVKQWVTYHGFALNIAPDLRHFQGIVPCGITEGSVTSIEQELGVAPPLAEVARQVENAFWERFPLTPNK